MEPALTALRLGAPLAAVPGKDSTRVFISTDTTR